MLISVKIGKKVWTQVSFYKLRFSKENKKKNIISSSFTKKDNKDETINLLYYNFIYNGLKVLL